MEILSFAVQVVVWVLCVFFAASLDSREQKCYPCLDKLLLKLNCVLN